jgi:hypothetical protein
MHLKVFLKLKSPKNSLLVKYIKKKNKKPQKPQKETGFFPTLHAGGEPGGGPEAGPAGLRLPAPLTRRHCHQALQQGQVPHPQNVQLQ